MSNSLPGDYFRRGGGPGFFVVWLGVDRVSNRTALNELPALKRYTREGAAINVAVKTKQEPLNLYI